MKISEKFISYESSDVERLLVSISEDADDYHGFVRANESASFVVALLKNDISEDEIVKRVKAEFDAPEDVIREDLREILTKLRSIGAIEE